MKYQERLAQYQAQGLGLERGAVRLVEHHPRWKRSFSDEAHLLYDHIRIEGLRLYHVGSSSIATISAKPIIDILGSVPSLAELDSKRSLLEELGYEYKGEYGIAGRRYSTLYDAAKERGFVHLHIFAESDPKLQEHLLFRDYLRSHRDDAAAYEMLKKKLVASGTPRKDYSSAKEEEISRILVKAKGWQARSKKTLALLGSAPGHKNTLRFLNEKYPDAQIAELWKCKISPYSYSESFEDDFPKLIERMIEADLTVFATPVYWYAMSGPTKDFFDRFSNLLRGPHKHLGEGLNGKKFALLSTGYDERLPFGYEVPFASSAIYMAMDYMGAAYRSDQN